MISTFTSKKSPVQKSAGTDIIRSVKAFFGIRVGTVYSRSRIVRKSAKTYEEFIFKGYDLDQPGIFKPASFKKIRIISKN